MAEEYELARSLVTILISGYFVSHSFKSAPSLDFNNSIGLDFTISIKTVPYFTPLRNAQSSTPRTIGCIITGSCCLSAIRVTVEVLTGNNSWLDKRLPSFPVSSIDSVFNIFDTLTVLLEYLRV